MITDYTALALGSFGDTTLEKGGEFTELGKGEGDGGTERGRRGGGGGCPTFLST